MSRIHIVSRYNRRSLFWKRVTVSNSQSQDVDGPNKEPVNGDDVTLNNQHLPPLPDPNGAVAPGSVPYKISRLKREQGLHKIFNAESVVVIGGSIDPDAVGHEVIQNIKAGGYQGDLYAVNPKYAGQSHQFNGEDVSFFQQVQDLPDNIDLAVIMIPSTFVPDVMHELGAKGISAAVLISAGFGETGTAGKALAADLDRALEQHEIVMVGPNCLGIANSDSNIMLNATFVRRPLVSGHTAIVSQSGAVGIDLVDRAQRAGMGISQFASVGNSAQTNAAHIIQHWEQDPNVKVIAAYLESIPEPKEFREICQEVSKTKPICLIKAGRSSSGAKAASSHTGSLAGSDVASDALCEQAGIIRSDSIQELNAAVQALENAPASVGNRVAVYSNAGGYGVMIADGIELERKNLKTATLSADTETKLQGLLPSTASFSNPIDTTATVPVDDLKSFKQGLLAVANDPNVDSVIVSVVSVMGLPPLEVAEVIAEVQAITPKPVVAMLSVDDDEMRTIRSGLESSGRNDIALFTSLEDATYGLSVLEQRRTWLEKNTDTPAPYADVKSADVRGIIDAVRAEGRSLLTTTESLDVMNAYGIPVPPYSLANTEDEVVNAAKQMGYPVVIKLSSKTISHKTDIGGVALDLRDEAQLRNAFQEMENKLQKAGVTSYQDGEGIMVQPFLNKGREVIMGLSEDPQLGKLLMIGIGGIYVEVLKDVQFRLAPLTETDADDMLQGLQYKQILEGFRGKPSVDMEQLKEVMLRLSQLVQDFPELNELDINPFMARPQSSSGAGFAVDARMTIS